MYHQEKEITFNIGSDLYDGLLIDAGENGGVVLYPDWEGGKTNYAHRKAIALAKKLQCKVLVTDMYGKDRQPKRFSGDADVAMATLLADTDALRRLLASAATAYANILELPMAQIHVVGTCFGGTLAFEYGRSGAPVASVTCIHGDPASRKPATRFIDTRFLLIHGAADPLVGPEQINAFFGEMASTETDWQAVLLGNTKHGFTKEEVGNMNQSMRFDKTSSNRAFDYFSNIFKEQTS